MSEKLDALDALIEAVSNRDVGAMNGPIIILGDDAPEINMRNVIKAIRGNMAAAESVQTELAPNGEFHHLYIFGGDYVVTHLQHGGLTRTDGRSQVHSCALVLCVLKSHRAKMAGDACKP